MKTLNFSAKKICIYIFSPYECSDGCKNAAANKHFVDSEIITREMTKTIHNETRKKREQMQWNRNVDSESKPKKMHFATVSLFLQTPGITIKTMAQYYYFQIFEQYF